MLISNHDNKWHAVFICSMLWSMFDFIMQISQNIFVIFANERQSVRSILSRNLSIDSELLQLQRGTSGNSSADELDRDEVYRWRQCDYGAAVQDPMRQALNDLPFWQLGPAKISCRGALQGHSHNPRSRHPRTQSANHGRNRNFRFQKHLYDARVDRDTSGIL